MRQCYDLVVGMGTMCSCSQALRESGLQLSSFPFDWNGGPGVRGKTDLILNDFAGFISRERMFRQPEPKFSYNQYWDDDLGFKYYHDFPMTCDFDTEYVKVREKYKRRIERMYDFIKNAKRVLFVYVECKGWPKCTSEDVAYCRQRLAERWPSTQFDFLVFCYEKGIPFRKRREEWTDGCRMVVFDYKDPKEEDWRADYHLMGRWLAREYSVRDYRTPEERREWDTRYRRELYARFKANNPIQLFWHKEQFKLYKHLRTRLERLGVI